MYHLRRIKSLMLTLLVCTVAQAQLENGKVYNFVNIANSVKSMVWVSGDELSVADTDQSDNKQLWYVVKNDDNSYSLRNLDNGKYLRSPNAKSSRWTTVDTANENCKFECVRADYGYSLRATNSTGSEHDFHFMHYSSANGGQDRIVCWSTTNPSQWTINEVDFNERVLDYMFASDYKDVYQTALSNLFTDNSCSELKSPYASYTESQMKNDANYQQLSVTLQKMVLKVLNDSWEEDNYATDKLAWENDYAKKYRVQLYEPYNETANASAALGLNEHTNLNNPTGIFANSSEALYVMVEGEIKEGAYLYLASYTGQNRLGAYNKGVELQPGLNIIPSDAVGNNYCINYVVKTFDTSDDKRGHEAKMRPLSEYPDLKIHIEGGYINGYYNKMGDYRQEEENILYAPDKNADWEYIEERATQTTVSVLGKYMLLQFPLNDADTEGNKGMASYLNDLVNVEDVINSWDNVMMWERFVLGVLDESTLKNEVPTSPYSNKQVFEYTGNDANFPAGYGDYYNVHGMAWGCGGGTYMYGAGDHSGYHYNTMGGIIQTIPTAVGSLWGPAHEIGHQHQNLLQIRGEKEVTNNLFANVVLWCHGVSTSRVNGGNGTLENVLANFNKEDGHYLTNSIWGMTQMYYKLFLYYHVLGHDTKFYPRFFEMLRQDPTNGMAGEVNGAEAQLKLYKTICMAAGEDLTEFFRAHGFFKPLNGFSIDDYGVSTFYMTQAQINAAIAEVKDLGYPENISVLFINDATGESIQSHKGGTLVLHGETNTFAEMGGYASFEQAVTNNSDLTYTISGKNVTVSGDGGVGYAIYNAKGEIIAFSNKKTFTISDECAEALMWGEATMKVVNADNSEAPLVQNTDEVAAKYSLLGGLIAEANAELQYADDTNTKVGYYIGSELATLRTILAEAQSVYENEQTDKYTAVYTKLSEELYAVTHSDYNRVSLMSGGTYRLNSRSDKNSWMSVNTENKVIGAGSNTSDTKQEWIFEATDKEDVYYIKNASTSRYLKGMDKNEQVSTTENKSEAVGYKAGLVEAGVWTLQGQDSHLQFMNRSGTTVLGWNDGNDHNSQWYITTVSVGETAEKLYELNTLVKKTKELIDEMAEVTPTQRQTLQTSSSSSPFYLSTNACHNTLNNASDGQGLAGLLDEDVETFFHSDWWGTIKDTHYLQVDLGSNAMDLSQYIFYYTTRANGANCPTTIEVWGSTDGTNFNTLLYTFTGLPTEGKQTWESPMLTAATSYRSLRFMVTKAEGDKKFFVMSRFGIAKCEATVQSMGKEYTAQGLTNDALISAYASIHNAQDKVKVGGFTSNELTSLYEGLLTKYDALETIYNNAANGALDVLRGKLRSLIGEVENLYKSCGSVEVIEAVAGTEVTGLQTTNPNGDYYVWTNAQSTQEGPISGLIDGLYGTGYTDKPYYFHSAYSGETITDGLKHHHITINLGTNNAVSAFKFQYRNRTDAGVGFPAEIEVYGSIDGSSYNKIITLNDMEKNSTAVYTSPVIETSKEYAYLRFMVTKSSGDKSYFHMAEFDLYVGTPSYYDVTLNGTHGEVDDDMMIATYDAIVAAQASVNIAATEAQLQKTINKLQAQYDVLYEAKNAAQYFTVKANIDGGGVRYDGGDPCTSILAVSASLTIEQLKEKLVAIELGGYVAQPISITDGVITVTYNKVYSVQVVGVDAANGGVTSGEATYKGGDTFNILESEFNIENFTVIDLPEYAEYKEFDGTTITVTYKKVYTVNVVGVEAANGGVTSGEATYKGGDTFEMLESVFNIEDFNVIDLQGYEEYKTFENAIITITYNKVYTVTITGGEGEGRVTFGDDEYANGKTFEALQNSFTAADLTAKDVEGYTKSEVTVNHETGAISVTYTLDRTTLGTLIGDTDDLLQACSGFVNSDYVTAALLEETYAAWITAQNALETVQTRSELNDALNDLQTAHDKLDAAKTSAEQEAAERTELNGQLSTLITQTEDVIASCYDNDELKFVNSEFVTEESISAVRELVTAANAKCAYNGTTATEYSASITALTTAKSELATAIANAEEEAEQRVRLKSELQELVNSTTDLMELCGTVSEVENQEVHEKLPLQVTSSNGAYYLSSNADQNVVGNAPDGAGIAGLLDGYVDTYMHTQWGGTAVADDHHVQVSLGEGKSLTEFTFTYATRWTGNADKTSPAPTVIKVYGSVGGESWSKLATFPESDEDNPLPASGDLGKYWTSARIESDASYKYLRFVVTNSQGPGNNTYGGHCFFAMSEFAITSIYNYTGPIAEVDVNAGSVTEEQLLAAYTENEEAKALIEGVAVSNADLTTAIKDLTDAKDVLQAAYGTKILPVTLSKSHENPVLYTLHLTGRGDNKVLQYEPASGHMFSVVDVVEGGSAKQAFYFMPGDERTQVYVLPYAAGEQVLAADNTGSGAAKVSAKEQGSAQFEQWKFVESTIEGSEVVYYNLQPTTGISSSVYFSHYGGGSNKMGFYTSIDEGSRLTFTPVEIERSAAYHSLNVYYTEAAKVASSEIVGDDEVGYYPKSEAKAYNEAYPVAGATLTKEDATYAEYLDAYKKFFTANEALVINMPEEGKFYRLRSVKRSSEENPEYAYVNPEENRIFHTSSRGISDATTIWSFVEMSNGTYKMTNLHTGTSLANNGWEWYTALSLYDDAEGVNIVSLSTDGQVGFKCDGIMLHADGNGKVVHWETGANDGSAWRIEEVEDMSLVNFALTITQYRHAGLYLNYSVEIPKEGIKVYIAHTSNGTTGEIIADELDGTIIPARTAVIVKGDADTYNFKYTTEGYDGTENLDNNLLGGSAYLKYQQVDQAGNLCCVFGQKGGVVGLYKNWVGYTDANGTVAEDTNSDGKVNEDNGTYFKISANKIYYEYTPFEGNGASAFRFRLNDKEDTTELDTLIMTEDSVIYNLYGQRLKEIIVPGFYIINGKKVYVNEKMINNK